MEKEPSPPPEQERKESKPFKLEIKKKEKKEPPPEPEPPAPTPEEMFKIRKKSSTPRKVTPKKEEEDKPAFAGMKLKKAEQVKRTWEDEKLETVELKHHEFEEIPLEEEVTYL